MAAARKAFFRGRAIDSDEASRAGQSRKPNPNARSTYIKNLTTGRALMSKGKVGGTRGSGARRKTGAGSGG